MLACNFKVDKTHTTQHAVNHFKIESTTVQNNKLDSDLVQIGYIHKQSTVMTAYIGSFLVVMET